jgi:hypothetical protein
MCSVLLPPGVNPIAVYIYISYHIISYIIYLFYLYYLIFINEYMVLFLFNNEIYAFLLLWLCILILCLCKTTLTEVFPCFFLSCKANARVKTRKDGARPALFQIFVLFCVFLCFSMYCLFCVVVCIVCYVSFSVLFVCICVLYYCHRVATQLQLTNISYHIISF